MTEGVPKEPRISRVAMLQKGWPFRKATLYVYVEADPSLGAETLAEAAQEALRRWQRSHLSRTAALREAALAGMQAMASATEGASTPGISCAALQEGAAYLAQGGTTRAYILAPQVCRRVASTSPWDPAHIDVREEALPPGGMLLLAPSLLEGALPLLQGGLPPREVQRLVQAWLQGRPQLSALLVGREDGRNVALAAGAQTMGERPEPTASEAAGLVSASPREAHQRAQGQGEGSRREVAFPLLRAAGLPLLAVAALLALLILGGLGWYLPGRQKGEDEGRLVATLEKASQARREALLYSDPALARGGLAQAESLAREAAAIRSQDRRVTSLRQEIEKDLDRVNAVVRPTSISPLVDLSKLGGSQSNPSRVLVESNNLYVLDKGVGRVYKFLLDQSGQSTLNTPNNILVRKGDLYGGSPLADFWEAIWMPPGPLRAGGSLLVLDSQGALLDYRPERAMLVLPLRGVRSWASFRGARGYNGNLYILDPVGEQIWRYIPTSSGYDSEARGILERAQISDAVDLAVDGNVYVLTAKGLVWSFAGGAPQTFRQEKMDRPLSSPAALFASPSTRFLYVADRGNSRLVAFTKDGEFRFQVRAEALEGVQGVFVDEGQGRLYFAAGQKVFAASVILPKP